jgi:hypothetical protein
MINKLIGLTALLLITSFLASCANTQSSAPDERKTERTKSSMYAR